jgi:hypothetical protein
MEALIACQRVCLEFRDLPGEAGWKGANIDENLPIRVGNGFWAFSSRRKEVRIRELGGLCQFGDSVMLDSRDEFVKILGTLRGIGRK